MRTAATRSQQIDAIRGIETVKALARRGRASASRCVTASQGSPTACSVPTSSIMTYQGAVQLVTFLARPLPVRGGLLSSTAQLTMGEFVAFNALVLLTNGPVARVALALGRAPGGAILLDRLGDVIEAEPEQGCRSRLAKEVRTVEGAVRLRDVGFRYAGPEAPPCSRASASRSSRATVALVGRSGSGRRRS